MEKAIFAHVRYRLDQHYMIHEEKIVIIDEYTGRRFTFFADPDGLPLELYETA